MGYAILKDQGAIRNKIRELFTIRTRSRRRVILGPVAGLVPLDHLPDIHDVELYSWGQESLPDLAPLATLAEKGVRVNWVNPMHLRLYWVKGKGAVIGPGFRSAQLLVELDREDHCDPALYLDAAALMAVDEVLGPLLLDPAGSDTFSDLQESCTLLWRLAEGITSAEPVKVCSTKALPRPAKPGLEDSPQTRQSLAILADRQRASVLESWYNFLAEETQGDEGLLCFYDRPRTKRIEHYCRFYVCLNGVFGG
jgi:hypothetical protein